MIVKTLSIIVGLTDDILIANKFADSFADSCSVNYSPAMNIEMKKNCMNRLRNYENTQSVTIRTPNLLLIITPNLLLIRTPNLLLWLLE